MVQTHPKGSFLVRKKLSDIKTVLNVNLFRKWIRHSKKIADGGCVVKALDRHGRRRLSRDAAGRILMAIDDMIELLMAVDEGMIKVSARKLPSCSEKRAYVGGWWKL